MTETRKSAGDSRQRAEPVRFAREREQIGGGGIGKDVRVLGDKALAVGLIVSTVLNFYQN